MDAPTNPVRRWTDGAIIALFCAGMTVPLATQLSGWSTPDSESTENRRAAEFPQLEFRQHGLVSLPRKASLIEFPEKFEAYFNDHLGLRRELIRCYSMAKVAGLAPGALSNLTVGKQQLAPVIVGREGWLYYTGESAMENYRRTSPFTTAELEDWTTKLLARQRWLAARGIPFVVMFTPDKPTIYPEYLPRAINRVGDHSRLDQLVAHLRKHSELIVVDVRDVLEAGKAQHPTYHRTDTHWNQYGAFLGYQKLMGVVQQQFTDAPLRQLADYTMEIRDDGPPFDLAKMLDSPVPMTDTIIELEPRSGRHAVSSAGPTSSEVSETKRSLSPSAVLPRLTVLHDSFFWNLMPLVDEDWQEIEYFRTTRFPATEIDRFRPQLVIQEMVERQLKWKLENPAGLEAETPLDWARKPTDAPVR
jgi:alginate O-acetyltransferase complex protein AlgJ